MTQPFPKPPRRFRASGNQWIEIHDKMSHERCWICGEKWHSLHHIVRKSQGGDDVIANLAPLCGTGTTGCHGKVEARDPEALAALRAALRPHNLHYIERYRKSSGWLERAYPEAA